MSAYVAFIALAALTLAFTGATASAEEGPLSEVQTAVGLEVALPCDFVPTNVVDGDRVQLVIWSKKGNTKPIYTFDARNKPLNDGISWSDEIDFKKRAEFYYDSSPPALRIKNIHTSDAGLYQCRVDFKRTPTRNWRINLTVLVPPKQLVILDNDGASIHNDTAGPYLEGDTVSMTCLSSGGIPPPRVTWWREHSLIDESFEILPDGSTRNILLLKNIQRKDLLTVYTCQASNGHVVAALTRKVILDMNLPPLSLLLQGLNHAVVAGTRTHVTCTAEGARPAPVIIWTKGDQVLESATHSTSPDGNRTISELLLIPVPEDNERSIGCAVSLGTDMTSRLLHEGRNTVLAAMGPGMFLRDSRILNVTHAPIVNLRLGTPLDLNNLVKGSDAYLECDVRANPAISRVEWYHNDNQLHSSRGIIIANQTLVLQGISESSHGQYFCRATNAQGSVSSNEVYLDVKYPPTCKSDSIVIRAALKQTVTIICEVDANPLDNLYYKWYFNNSLENQIQLPNDLQDVGALPIEPVSSSLHANSPPLTGVAGYHQRNTRRHVRGDTLQVRGPHRRTLIGPLNHNFEDIIDGHKGDEIGNAELSKVRTEDPVHSAVIGDFSALHQLADYEALHYSAELPKNPFTQMVYSSKSHNDHMDGKQHFRKLQRSQHQQHQATIPDTVEFPYHRQLQQADRKRPSTSHLHRQLHKQQYRTTTPSTPPFNNVYRYHVENYENFGAISCVAQSPMGKTQPCWYHIQPADLPEPVKNCSAGNSTDSTIQIRCVPGYNGGIPQYFYVSVYDGHAQRSLFNATYKLPEITVRRLPSDSLLTFRITAQNAQGYSKAWFQLLARTLPAPLMRTESSKANFPEVTIATGALLGAVVSIFGISLMCLVTKTCKPCVPHNSSAEVAIADPDKGSAQPLSRNMSSNSSLEDKNPDVVPQDANSEDELHLEDKEFKGLNPEQLQSSLSRVSSTHQPSARPSANYVKQYGELSLTTNPAYSLYNTPPRALATQRAACMAPPSLLSTRAPQNIYTRVPTEGRGIYLPPYEARTLPTSPYGSTTNCTVPLLAGQSNISLQTNASNGSSSNGCNTFPLTVHMANCDQPAALSSSATSSSIAVGTTAGHTSLLAFPYTQAAAYSSLSSSKTAAVPMSPLLKNNTALLFSGSPYEAAPS